MRPSWRDVVVFPAELLAALIGPLAVVLGILLPTSPAFAQPPGGILEKANSNVIRPLWTSSQIQGFLPARGKFTFPAPYNTEGVRLTNSSDCGGADCVFSVGYSYWRNMNNHRGSDTMLIFLGLRGAGGPTLFSYNKLTEQVSKVGPLFDPNSPFASHSGEGWYFSATQPTKLYLNSGAKLLRYDVQAKTFQTVFDATTQFGGGRYIWQVHSSDDDNVHSATLRDSGNYAMLGCFAYREATAQFSYYPAQGAFDECQVDKSGRWLLIKENVDGIAGEDNRIIDLQAGTEWVLLDQNGAAGHSDNGYGYLVADDNWNALPGAIRIWNFDKSTPQGFLAYHTMNWGAGGIGHVAHSNARPGVPLNEQYACGGGATTVSAPRANEIVCFRLDNSLDVLVVTQNMTDLNAPGGGDSYSKLPKGNFDVTGTYFIWASNMGGSRNDAFLVKVPAQLLTGGGSDTTPPVVAITEPLTGQVLAGTVPVSATAVDNVGVLGVQFRVDGAELGPEVTNAPYSTSWDTTGAANGSHTLTAVARDAAGNTAVSPPVVVIVSNDDGTPPVISSVSSSNVSASGATITWTTDEPADSQVEYGLSPAYGSSTALDPGLVFSHSQALSGLNAETLYHYRVRSRDAGGNLAVSADFTFTTRDVAGPVAHWKLDEGSGGTAADSSGNGNTGSLNGPVWTAGRSGQALAFDGVNDHVRAAHAAMLNAYPLTVAAWFKTSTTAGVRGLVNKYLGGSYNGYQIFFNNGDLCAWYLRDGSNYIYDGGGCTMKTAGYNDGGWHQVVFVADASGGRLHVDGIQTASQPWTGLAGPPSTAEGVLLGYYPGAFGGAEYLPGLIDEVRIYDRALTAEEVRQLYEELEDVLPPVISGVGVADLGSDQATIVWNSDEPADSQVEYGTTPAYGSSSVLDPTLVTAHAQVLSGLAPSTLYHYRVRSRDAAGNLAVSSDFTFTTLAGQPPSVAITTPLPGQILAGIVPVAATASDDVGVLGVQFRVDGADLGPEVTNPPYSTLWDTAGVPNGPHTLTAVARDTAGYITVSAPVGVTVNNDTLPPVISAVSSSNVSPSGATITWTTDEPADSQVEYGTTPSYGSSTTLDPGLVFSHSQALSGLKASTLYHYRVRSRDAGGNLAVSADFTFTTLGAPPSIAEWKLDEGSGNTAADSSGNGNTGSLVNGPVWTAGRSGQALAFDGVNDHVRVAHTGMLNAYPLTVAAWFKTSTTTGVRGLVNKYVGGSYNGYQVFFNNGQLCAWYLRDTANFIYDGSGCTMKTAGYNDGRWHQVVFVADAAGGRLYVDGIPKASRPWTGLAGPPSAPRDVYLGRYPGAFGGASYLPGLIDEVRMYDRALTAEEVRQLYDEMPPLP